MTPRYIKVYTAIARDEKIAHLPSDAARWAFIAILAAAKEQRPGGSFASKTHLEACVTGSVAKSVPALLKAGLLTQRIDGRIEVASWAKWQVDPTNAERSARHRAAVAQRSRNGQNTVGTRLETGRQGDREIERQGDRKISSGIPSVGQIILKGGNL